MRNDHVFRGQSEYTLDDKGRLLLPIRYREGLGSVVTVTGGTFGQINIYPKALYDKMLETAQEMEESGEMVSATLYLAAGEECEVDRQGRINIPSLLRRSANLGSDVVVVGNVDHIQVWEPGLWLASYQGWVKQFQANKDDADIRKMRQRGIRL